MASQTVARLLATTDFPNLSAIRTAAKDAGDTVTGRLLDVLRSTFNELDSTEDSLTKAYASLERQCSSDQQYITAGANFTEPQWIASSAARIAEYSAKRAAAIDKIQHLIWILTGEAPN